MKKILLLLTVLVLALSVTACNKTTGNDNDSSKDNNKRTESSDDNRNDDEKDNDNDKSDNDNKGKDRTEAATEETTTASAAYTPSEEILAASRNSNMVQIGDTILYAPFTYQELIDTRSTTSYLPDYLIDVYDSIYIDFLLDDTKYDTFYCNISDELFALKNAQFHSITTTSGDNIFFAGGVHLGMTISEVEAVWGEADDMQIYNDDTLLYKYNCPDSEIGTKISIHADRNTYVVYRIYINYRTEEFYEYNDQLIQIIGGDVLY